MQHRQSVFFLSDEEYAAMPVMAVGPNLPYSVPKKPDMRGAYFSWAEVLDQLDDLVEFRANARGERVQLSHHPVIQDLDSPRHDGRLLSPPRSIYQL